MMDLTRISENINKLELKPLMEPLEELKHCRICPRNCNADRFSGRLGYCKADSSFSISSVFAHRGEEPPISGDKGICNIFFTNCNLQCIYCQNYQISCNANDYSRNKMTLKQLLQQVSEILSIGINLVGFVSPSHFVPQVKVIISSLREIGLDPVFVYNTNGYDRPEVIRSLEHYIDVYLPDFKYADEEDAAKYSDATDYPDIALSALKEMFRQKGADLPLDHNGYARKGILIRHLVLPGHPENSINVLRTIAKEVSNDLHISLMSQYYPTQQVMHHESLGRTLRVKEYYRVVEEMGELGFENGWVQNLSSHESYRPDFDSANPFE
jgi:putative pyruvate formate lyase activating enzyme